MSRILSDLSWLFGAAHAAPSLLGDPRAPLLRFSPYRCLVAKVHSRVCWKQGIMFRTEWSHQVFAIGAALVFLGGVGRRALPVSGCPREQRVHARGAGAAVPRAPAQPGGRAGFGQGQVQVLLCVPCFCSLQREPRGDAPPGAFAALPPQDQQPRGDAVSVTLIA